jgi:hypothetical protein
MTWTSGMIDDELNELRLAYKRAFDEYSEATFAIDDRIRRGALPAAEEFARKRAAHTALLNASDAVWQASRRGQQAPAWIFKSGTRHSSDRK